MHDKRNVNNEVDVDNDEIDSEAASDFDEINCIKNIFENGKRAEKSVTDRRDD